MLILLLALMICYSLQEIAIQKCYQTVAVQSNENVTFFKILEDNDGVMISGTATSAFTVGFYNAKDENEIWYENDYMGLVRYVTFNNHSFPGMLFYKNGIDQMWFIDVTENIKKMYVQGVDNCQVHLHCYCRAPTRTKTHLEYCMRLRDFNANTF
ncbi:unnamed protein product [Caenorhabditis bovis]|uniref:Uncharacterized protein n=1 Tax=Caenorhabditis bovis TaxID=2654633 RepID=A0A8S1F775_9PELO|nr:unnamed protein product [Caenorhabditis bovis]